MAATAAPRIFFMIVPLVSDMVAGRADNVPRTQGKCRRGTLRSTEEAAMATLAEERCVACRSDTPRMTAEQIQALKREVPEWSVVERDGVPRLERVFTFANFVEALAFTNAIGALAEAAGHHPPLPTHCG